MLNTERIGDQIKNLRKKKNLTQEMLIGLIGDDNISLSTLKRIENGTGRYDLIKLSKVCEALNCDLIDLLDNNEVVSALEKNYSKDEEAEVLYQADLQRLFYPKPSKFESFRKKPILSILQLIIYLPLMDEQMLYDCLWRIEGRAFDNESYVLDKLALLYREIPDSEAKRYADVMSSRCTFDYYLRFICSSLTEEEKAELADLTSKEKGSNGYEDYMTIISEKLRRLTIA